MGISHAALWDIMFSTQLSNQQLSSTPFQGLTPRCWPYQGPRVQIKIRGTWLQFMTLARLCVGVWCSCLFFKTPTLPKKNAKMSTVCDVCLAFFPVFVWYVSHAHGGSCYPFWPHWGFLFPPPPSAPSFQVVDTPLVNPATPDTLALNLIKLKLWKVCLLCPLPRSKGLM